VERAKQWFYANKEDINTLAKCFKAFLAKFFPIGKTNALRGKITNFQQQKIEPFQKHGNVCKDTFKIVLIMEWKNGYSCKAFIMD